MLDDAKNKHLLNLRIISNIPAGGRLNTLNKEISIYEEWSVFSWVQRKVYGDGREATIEKLRKIYKDVDNYTNEVIAFKDEHKDSKNINNTMITILGRTCESLKGIHNLQEKYEDDQTNKVHLQHIEYDIVRPIINKIKKNLPKDKIPKNIQSMIINLSSHQKKNKKLTEKKKEVNEEDEK